MSEVQTFFKENCGECGCGCEKSGTYRTRPWRNGVLCVRTCRTCPNCRGKANRTGGVSEQRKFQKAAGVKSRATRKGNTNEEHWVDHFRWEHKSGGIVRPVVSAYLKTKMQAEASRAIGDNRPFAMGVTYEGTRLVTIEADVWREWIVPLLEESA